MVNAALTTSLDERIADLGGIAIERIRANPPPGMATIEDLIRINNSAERPCELVDNTLVEKEMGWRESLIAAVLLRWLGNYVESMNLGVVTGADGITMLFKSVARGSDVAFTSWKSLPNGCIPDDPVPLLVPDFVIEVLSRGNTRAEMARKRREYFQGGVQLAWMVDIRARTIAVYTSPEEVKVIEEGDLIDGSPVLPEWKFNTGQLFAELDRTGPKE